MPYKFELPDLGEGITEGEVREWKVDVGDDVEEHQTVVEIETDKAVVEVPSPRKGKVLSLGRKEGDIINVGDVLITISEEGDAGEEVKESFSVVGVLPEEPAEILALPAARSLAKKLGISLEGIRGTGPGGSITERDLPGASQKDQAGQDRFGPVEIIPLRGIRKTTARNLSLSQKMAAFVTSMDDADVTDLWNLRKKEKERLLDKGVHLTFLPFFIKAVCHALIGHPVLNASIDEAGGEIVVKKYYNFGIAIDIPDGLLVPVIRDVDKKSIIELAVEISAIGEKARERKISLDEMKGSTFSITNYGHFGGTYSTPIINYPDVAILGTGRIDDKAWVRNGEIEIRKILPVSLTFDHRVTDGVDSALFLTRVIEYLEDPGQLFSESI